MNRTCSILVTGGGGALGRAVIDDLAASRHRILAGTRNPEKIAQNVRADVEVRRIDFDDPVSLETGLQAIERLLIVSTDELATPGKRQRQHRAALEAARGAGVSFIAYTSMPDPIHSHAIPFAPDHVAMELALQESGIRHAVLRNCWYQENLLAYLPQIIADGRWFTAAGVGRLPYVARGDAAGVAAGVLISGEEGILDIVGSEAVTVAMIAAAVGETLGRRLEVNHVDEEQVVAELTRQGVSASVIPMVSSTEAHQKAGGFDIRSNAVQRLTGRPPRALAEFLRANAIGLLAHSG